MAAHLYRVILPVDDMDRADAFWSALLELPVDPVVPNRHYLHTEGAILALVDPAEHARAHGLPPAEFRPNPDLVYFAVEDLDAAWERAQSLGMQPLRDDDVGEGIQTQPWGERSFYGVDPSGNPICLVDEKTLFTGSA